MPQRSFVQGQDSIRLPPVRVIAAAQPSSVIPGRMSAAKENCAFYREEVEAHATCIRSGMSRDEGRTEAYRSRHIRFGTMRALCNAISKKYSPEGVSRVNFHEPQDGKQRRAVPPEPAWQSEECVSEPALRRYPVQLLSMLDHKGRRAHVWGIQQWRLV